MNDMNWNSLGMTEKVYDILRQYQTYEPDHMGTVFVSSYQIALALDEKTREKIGKPIGGAGTGESSLAGYIAKELSQRISRGEIENIEGAWLARKHILDVQFKDKEGGREFSPAGGNKDVILSMFRIKPHVNDR